MGFMIETRSAFTANVAYRALQQWLNKRPSSDHYLTAAGGSARSPLWASTTWTST